MKGHQHINLSSFPRLKKVQLEREALNERLKIVLDETLTAEERAQKMDELLKEEENRIYEVEKQLARLRETQVLFVCFTISCKLVLF